MGTTFSKAEVKKDLKPQPLFILVLGETGAGKSTLINTLYLWQQITLKQLQDESSEEEIKNSEEATVPDDDDGLIMLKSPLVAIPVPPCKKADCKCGGIQYPVAEKWKHLVSEADFFDQSVSQTSEPAAYCFTVGVDMNSFRTDEKPGEEEEEEEPDLKYFEVHILDTPGFADTRCSTDPLIEQKNITAILRTVVQKKVPYISALLYLYNGALTRSSAIEKVINSLTKIFPRSFENFICLATNTGKSGTNAQIEKQFEFIGTITKQRRYEYDNCLFKHYFPNLPTIPKKKVKGKAVLKGQKASGTFYLEDWNESYESVIGTLTNLIHFVSIQPPAKPEHFEKILNANSKLEVILAGLNSKLANVIQEKQILENDQANLSSIITKMNTRKEDLERYEGCVQKEKEKIEREIEIVKSNKDAWQQQINIKNLALDNLRASLRSVSVAPIWKTVIIDYEPLQVVTSYHNTICVISGCGHNCHEQCSLEKLTGTYGDVAIKGCWCINGDTCRVCGHSYEKHHHLNYLWKKEPKYDSVLDQSAMNQEIAKQQTQIQLKIDELVNQIRILQQNQATQAKPPDDSETIKKLTSSTRELSVEIQNMRKQVSEIQTKSQNQEKKVETLNNELETLKQDLKTQYYQLRELTFSSSFALYLSGLIADWKEFRAKQLATGLEFEKATEIIKHLNELLANSPNP